MSKVKSVKDRIMVTWCDNGTTDGKFTQGLVYTILTSGVPIVSAQRVQGNQIGRQRETAFNTWHKKTDIEWILWVDSDIVITNEAVQKLWDLADAKDKPVVTGTYFISKQNEQALMEPYPALFIAHPTDKYMMSYVHPMEENVVVKVDYAGFGFLLMHRSAADQMRKFHGEKPFFMETSTGKEGLGGRDEFIGEDIQFFMAMKEAGVPLYAHTGAAVQHMKRFAFDIDFYKLYWVTNMAARGKEKKAEA